MTGTRSSQPEDLPERWDLIVVGSGIGGLTVASLLARLRGLRVLVLEQHYRLGGFTHDFRRPGGHRWDVGLHYVGQMTRGDDMRGVMDLVTDGRVAWQAMPSPFERYVYPGLTIEQPVGRDAWIESLGARWPRERDGIVRYLAAVTRTARWLAPYLLSTSGPAFLRLPARALRRLGARRALATTAEMIDRCVRDRELKAVLASQWGDYGLPPGESAFVMHAVIVAHYLNGAAYPVGGAGTIAEGARAVIERAGGACLTGQRAQDLLLERGRVAGIRVLRGQGQRQQTVELRAPLVVSNAGARATFERLLGESADPEVIRCRRDLQALPKGPSAVQLFLGLRASPESIGLRGENVWVFDTFDHDAIYRRRNALLEGVASTAYVSFPSLKDPEAGTHTAEIIAPLEGAALAAWGDRPWKKRGEEYEALKTAMSRALLQFVDARCRGFASLVDYAELATPLSVEHFAAHADGAIYGLPPVPARFALDWLGVRTPVPGLLLTGSDVASHGIVGAMMGGVATAAHVMGASGFPAIMRAARHAPGSQP